MTIAPTTAEWSGCVADLLAPEPGDCVLLTGSAALALASAPADLDVMFIGAGKRPARFLAPARERRPEQQANGFSVHYVPTADGEVDVEFWPAARVERAIHEFGRGVAGPDEVEEHFTRLAGLERKVGLDLLHALRVGRPHPATVERARRLRDAVDWVRYFAWNRDVHLLNVVDGVKGTRKSLAEGLIAEAYLKVSWAADHVVDALTFHHARSISRWKWRLRYLAELDAPLQRWYRSVKLDAMPDADRLHEWVEVLATQTGLIAQPPRGV